MIAARENFNESQIQQGGKRNDLKGLVHGGPAHVLDDTEVIRECWDELESKTIPDCWTRSCFLLVCDLGDIASIQKQLIQSLKVYRYSHL